MDSLRTPRPARPPRRPPALAPAIVAALALAACGDDMGSGETDGSTGSASASASASVSASASGTASASASGTASASGSGTATDGTGTTAGGDDSLAQACVDAINGYRATLGVPAYARWTDAEACSDGEAESDSKSGVPHGAFGACGEWAQNECPGWPSDDPEGSLLGCLAQMWAEGPGADFNTHGHYINMSSTDYTKVACGFYTTGDGKLWALQNFQ